MLADKLFGAKLKETDLDQAKTFADIKLDLPSEINISYKGITDD